MLKLGLLSVHNRSRCVYWIGSSRTMDDRTFDHLTRGLFAVNSRRRLLTRLATMSLAGGLLTALDGEETLGKRRRKRRKPLVRNSFGCVDVGGKCRGNSA